MRPYHLYKIYLALLCLLLHSGNNVLAAEYGRGNRIDRIVVKYKQAAGHSLKANLPQTDLQHTQGMLRRSKYRTGDDADIYYLDQPRSTAEARRIAQELMQRADVEYAEPDYLRYPAFVPSDPGYLEQWYLKGTDLENGGIKAEQAWDIERGNKDIVIAVIDTGILRHEDILRVLPGYDFISPNAPLDFSTANDGDGRDQDPTDPGDAVAAGECGDDEPAEDSSWHGTLVAGLLVAETDNTQGIAGLDHRAHVLPLRAMGKCGGHSTDIADAIRWAAGLPVPGVPDNRNPADVINLSLGSLDSCTNAEQLAINAAIAEGVVVIAAAGNEGEVGDINSPASCDNVIAVAATTRGGAETCYTNVSGKIDLSAPGGNESEPGCGSISSSGIHLAGNSGDTTPESDDYYEVTGTSFATPMVSGVAALMKAVNNSLTPTSIEAILKNTARAFPTGTSDGFNDCTTSRCGSGILDAEGAVTAARDGGLDSVPNPFSFETRDNVVRNAIVISNTVSITGIDTPTRISISAGQGEYSIEGRAFTSEDGIINSGQTVRVRQTSSPAYDSSVSTTLSIGGVRSDFIVTTKKKSGGGGGAAGWLLPPCLFLYLRRRLQ